MNWLGRQVGHVTSAVKSDPTPATAKAGNGSKPAPKVAAKPTPKPAAAATPGGSRQGPSPRAASTAPAAGSTSAAGGAGMVIYREDKVEEAQMPDRPGVILRRTIIDEVVVETQAPPPDTGAAAK